ncbi:MAG: DUF1460 domain-containing protein, partial [Neisseriaceae bacterium]|nr:DUF1460 domain-containing protein [Neisseriaceae bacterium]
MKNKIISFIFLFLFSSNLFSHDIEISDSSSQKLDKIINEIIIPNRNSAKITLLDKISESFLDTPYVANTLIDSQNIPEKL